MSDDRLFDLMLGAAARTPDAPAVVDGDRTLSWEQLATQACRVAQLLIADGVQIGDRVGLWLDKSLASVAGLYGIMMAGAAYVPLDPSAPAPRLGRIVRSASIEIVLTDSAHRPLWSDLVTAAPTVRHLVLMDAESAAARRADSVRVSDRSTLHSQTATAPSSVTTLTADDLSYVLYTSGSTGEPKGVMHTHRSALAFVDWAVSEYGVTDEDRLSSHAPFHFDLSTFDLFAAARAGARTVLVPTAASVFPMSLRTLIETTGITVWYSVPAILMTLSQRADLGPDALPKLRTVLFAGEVFPTPALRDLMAQLPRATFANLYGPTETNVCTAWTCPRPLPDGDRPIPIGTPIGPDHVLVVDDDGNPVPDGDEGELWVGGGSVMQGYLGDSVRTEASLRRDPTGGTGGPMYSTGDLVQLSDDGALRYLGRRDDQVKVRGHRIEIGEVEAALHRHPAVTEAVVQALPDGAGSNRLVATVSVSQDIDGRTIQRHCGRLLPSTMVPSEVTVVASLPRTSTGKVDRRALRGLARS